MAGTSPTPEATNATKGEDRMTESDSPNIVRRLSTRDSDQIPSLPIGEEERGPVPTHHRDRGDECDCPSCGS
jgi:hypothetical protein